MKNRLIILSLLTGWAAIAQAAEPAKFGVWLDGISDGGRISPKYAFCAPDGLGKTKSSNNMNPAIRWDNAPKETKSFAIIVVDRDVPATFESANKDGQTIPENFARQDFYHWVLVDVPARVQGLPEGGVSRGVIERGKPVGPTGYGTTGHNDYAKVFKGSYGGYDGPCPPWNDERLHHYHFIVYALDVPALKLPAEFGGKEAEEAMKGHVLAQAEVVGAYSNYVKK